MKCIQIYKILNLSTLMFYFCFYISISQWNWCTGEISRCWKWIISIYLMTFRLDVVVDVGVVLFSLFLHVMIEKHPSVPLQIIFLPIHSSLQQYMGMREYVWKRKIVFLIDTHCYCWFLSLALWRSTASGFIVHFWLSFGSNELGNKMKNFEKWINGFQSINWVQSWQMVF